MHSNATYTFIMLNSAKILRCFGISLENKLISVRSLVTYIGSGPDRVLPADKGIGLVVTKSTLLGKVPLLKTYL